MAFTLTTRESVGRVLKDLKEAVEWLEKAHTFMIETDMASAMLQSSASPGYASSLLRFAKDSDLHVRDQHESPDNPLWKQSIEKTATDKKRSLKKRAIEAAETLGVIEQHAGEDLSLDQLVRLLELSLAKNRSERVVRLIRSIRESGFMESAEDVAAEKHAFVDQNFVEKPVAKKAVKKVTRKKST